MILDYEYFTSRSIQSGGCLEWAKCRNENGYGVVGIGNGRGGTKMWRASRAAYMAYHAVMLPSSVMVCHTCDNPPCVNVEHLFLGSARDNARDALSKGRLKTAKRKLSDDDLIVVRAMLSAGEMQETIAALFGVSGSLISMVGSGRWRPSVKH